MSVESSTVKRRSFQTAVKWSFVMHWGHRGTATLMTLILAAILGPTAFGVVAMAMVYIALIEMLLEQGMSAALIQRKDLQREHLDSAFWLLVVAGLLLTAVSLALSGWWASVNNLPELAPVINALSLLVPIRCLTVVQQAFLKREMDFKSLAVRANVAVLVGGAVGIVMALLGFGVWALVGQKMSEALIALMLLWSLSRWRPRLRFSKARLKDLLGFSTASFINSVGVFAGKRSDVLLMGLFFGPMAVGLYTLANRLMSLVLQLSTRPLQTVALPQFSRSQGDVTTLKASVLSSIHMSATLAIPAMAALAGLSGLILSAVGPEWLVASGSLQVLCFLGSMLAVALFSAAVLEAAGKPGLLALITWTLTVVTVTSLTGVATLLADAAVGQQILGIAATRLVVFVLLYLPVRIIVLKRMVGITLSQLIRETLPAAGSGAAVWLFARGISATPWIEGLPPLAALFMAAVPTALCALAMLLLFDRPLRLLTAKKFGRLSPFKRREDFVRHCPVNRDQ